MKKKILIYPLIVIVILLMALKTNAQEYLISFVAKGVVTSLDTVIVENLNKGIRLTMSGSDTLHLGTVGINDRSTTKETIKIYPNPMQGQAELSFYASQVGNAQISITDVSGKKVVEKRDKLSQGIHRYQISGLKQGVYFIKINGENYLYTTKLISENIFQSNVSVKYLGSEKLQIANSILKSTGNTIDMAYAEGDQLSFKAFSGNYKAKITDAPSSSKTILFNFTATNTGNSKALWSCGDVLTVVHSAGNVAPVNKTVNYGTILTNLSGEAKCWITQNLGADQQAASVTDNTEVSAGWYWQFNKKQGFKYDNSIYPTNVFSTSVNENSDWVAINDPCGISLGEGWRIPTRLEWENADANGGWTGIDINNGYITPYSNDLWLHAAGYIYATNGILYNRGSSGNYWSSTNYNYPNAYLFLFRSDISEVTCGFSSIAKTFGMSVRCIMDDITDCDNMTTPNAGADQIGVCGNTTTLDGNQPTGSNLGFLQMGQWSVVSGQTSGFSFYDISAYNTQFTGTPGELYVLRWDLSMPPCTSPYNYEDVQISFVGNTITANAGPDVTTCGTSVTLNGNQPSISSMQTGQWTVVAQINTLTGVPVSSNYSFGSNGASTSNNSHSTFTGTAGITYTLRWTISNPTCPNSYDEMMIIIPSTATNMTFTHTIGSVAPETKTVTYGTVVTNLSGQDRCWITQNLGTSEQAQSVTGGGFRSEWYWQFNRTQGYKLEGTTRTPSTAWLTTNPSIGDWSIANDPCSILLGIGSGWRIPTKTEWDNVDNSLANLNDAYNSVLKIHASGYLYYQNGDLYNRGITALYWSSTQYNNSASYCFDVDHFLSSIPVKRYGFPLRCIKDDCNITVTATNPAPFCGPGSVNLSATATSGATINWYATSSGGTLLGTGASYTTPSISTTTSYYVQATLGNCTSPMVEVVAIVCGIPTIESVTPGTTACGSGSVTLNALATQAPCGNTFINWHATSTSTQHFSVLNVYGTQFQTPVLSTTTTYYVDATNICGTSYPRVPVTATVPIMPSITLLTGNNIQTICLGNAITNISYSVQNGTISGVPFLPVGLTFNSITKTISGTPNNAGSYPYTITVSNVGCPPVTATGTITVCKTPSIISTTAGYVCYPPGGSVTLSATVNTSPSQCTPTIYWYRDPVAWVRPSGTGATFTTPVLSTTTTYYVEASNMCGTSSPRVPVVATVYTHDVMNLTSASGSDNQTINLGSSINPITYSVSGGATGVNVSSLPPGVSSSYNSILHIFTISGTPTAVGTYTYTLTTTGNPCRHAEVTVTGTITITIVSSNCGAYVAPGVWKEFMCHNLGANTALDPFTYSAGINGDLYQWGRPADGHQLRNSSTTNTLATTNTPNHPNFILTDSYTNDWRYGGGETTRWIDAPNAKAANDPCPAGFRVPSQAQWAGVVANNTIGNWANGVKFGNDLFLPASGYRKCDGNVVGESLYGLYWSSTARPNQPPEYDLSYFLNFYSYNNQPNIYALSNYARAYGMSVRCIKE